MKCFLDDSPRSISLGMEDQLNRKGFAKTITEILMASDSNFSLALSIEDKWGMGKTTFLSMLDYYCKDAGGDKVITFYFSPWVFSSQENLICDFLSQLADKLYLYPGRKYIELAKRVKRYSELFNAIRYVPKIGFYFEIAINIIKNIANGVLSFEDIKNRGVGSVKKDISLKIRELDCRIFVFLDDIDRLPPQQVLDMMCLVKAIANFSHVYYILAYDHEYVVRALQTCKIPYPDNYLDKIIQVRLTLPHIEEEILQNILLAELENFSDCINFVKNDLERIQFILNRSIKHLIKSLRGVKRFINRVAVTSKKTKGEVLFSDMLCLDILALNFPCVYRSIKDNPGVYTLNGDNSVETTLNKDKIRTKAQQVRDNILKNVIDTDQKYVSTLLSFLFPGLDSVSSYYPEDESIMHLRVSNISRLHIALTFDLPSSQFSTTLVDLYCKDKERRSLIIKGIDNEKHFKDFIDQLEIAIERENVPEFVDFLNYLAVLYDSSFSKSITSKKYKLFYDVFFQIKRIALLILNKNSKEMSNALHRFFTDKKNLSLSSEMLRYYNDLNIKKDYDEDRDLKKLDSGELDKINKEWFKIAIKVIESGQLFNYNGAKSILILCNYIDRDGLGAELKKLTNKSDFVDELVLALAPIGNSSSKGKFVHFEDDLLDLYGIKDELKSFAPRRLSEIGRTDIFLMASYKSIIDGKEHYLQDEESLLS